MVHTERSAPTVWCGKTYYAGTSCCPLPVRTGTAAQSTISRPTCVPDTSAAPPREARDVTTREASTHVTWQRCPERRAAAGGARAGPAATGIHYLHARSRDSESPAARNFP